MGMFARNGFTWPATRRPPRVQCAVCGSRFESSGAATGARLRCPLCSEEVEVDRLVQEKRRVPSQRAQAPDLDANRVPRRSKRRVVETLALLLLLLAGIAVLWAFRDRLADALGAATDDSVKSR